MVPFFASAANPPLIGGGCLISTSSAMLVWIEVANRVYKLELRKNLLPNYDLAIADRLYTSTFAYGS